MIKSMTVAGWAGIRSIIRPMCTTPSNAISGLLHRPVGWRGKLPIVGIIFGLCAELSGCTLLSGSAPIVMVDLDSVSDIRVVRTGVNLLQIANPNATQELDTENVLIKDLRNGTLTYLGLLRWPDALPRIIQARLIESFETANKPVFAADGSNLRADYFLVVNVNDFTIEVTGARSRTHIDLAVKLVNLANDRIIGARSFQDISAPRGGALVSLPGQLNIAFGKLVREIVPWASRHMARTRKK